MEISVGHTPDADDAFMFYGMFTGKVSSPDFTVTHVIEDIENLNRKAVSPVLDVTAVSVHACAYIPDYTILRSGGSFGIGYGPIITATKEMKIQELQKGKIAIPGKMTSAFLLLQLMNLLIHLLLLITFPLLVVLVKMMVQLILLKLVKVHMNIHGMAPMDSQVLMKIFQIYLRAIMHYRLLIQKIFVYTMT